VRSGGDAVAIGARFAGRLDIYDVRTGARRGAEVPVPFEPIIRMGSNGAIPLFKTDDQTLFGYVSVAATHDRIIALFSGRTRAGFPGRASLASQIHVFDWDGHLRVVRDLDRDVFLVAVSSDGSTLYAIGNDPVPSVFAFNLAGIERKREDP
jgi:hypothetical protein